ncbi:MAG: helix-turn-helix transcriptional regulator [Cyanobacteria bacterium J06598_1]
MAKGPLLQAAWDKLPDDRREAISARAVERIVAYRSLQELRAAAGLTQAKVSEALNMSQSNVSRLEKGSDMLLSTLQRYVAAMGGKLNLTVEMPDSPPIALTGLGDLIEDPQNPQL